MKHEKKKRYGGGCIPGTGFLTGLWHPAIQSDIERYRYSYKHLSLATGAFSEKSELGKGRFGIVYRGVLPTSGIRVAVKKLNGVSKNKADFMAEVLIMSQLQHRNLIQLLGWCKKRDKFLIVHKLIPNGSLYQALFGLNKEHALLSWPQRFNIVRGTAAALDYLHQGCRQQVIHRDVKSANILLDDEWNAKLGDFGLACLVDHQTAALTVAGTVGYMAPEAALTTTIAGTVGYMAPEIFATGKFTEKTDVFSFGAVALEIACGRRPFLQDKSPDERVLVDWVWQLYSKGDLLSVVDRRLDDYDDHWMNVVLLMGLVCSHPNPVARPTMRHVVQVLAGDVPVPRVPTSKPSSEFMTTIHSGSDSSILTEDSFSLDPRIISTLTSNSTSWSGEVLIFGH